MTDSYDIDYMISLIQERPVLWDKTIAEYKDKYLKAEAWKEVCNSLYKNFEELNSVEKTKIGNEVVKKWRGIKDNFTKYGKKIKELSRSGAGARKIKQYHLYNQLLFLNKNSQNATVTSIEDEQLRASTSTQQSEQTSTQQNLQTVMPRYQSVPRKRKMDEFENNIIAALEKPESRHLSFFKGILPSLEKLNDSQTIFFQSRVLQILTDLQQPSHYHTYQPNQNGHNTSQTPVQSGYQRLQSAYETLSPPRLPSLQTPSHNNDPSQNDSINFEEELTNLTSDTYSDYDFS